MASTRGCFAAARCSFVSVGKAGVEGEDGGLAKMAKREMMIGLTPMVVFLVGFLTRWSPEFSSVERARLVARRRCSMDIGEGRIEGCAVVGVWPME